MPVIDMRGAPLQKSHCAPFPRGPVKYVPSLRQQRSDKKTYLRVCQKVRKVMLNGDEPHTNMYRERIAEW